MKVAYPLSDTNTYTHTHARKHEHLRKQSAIFVFLATTNWLCKQTVFCCWCCCLCSSSGQIKSQNEIMFCFLIHQDNSYIPMLIQDSNSLTNMLLLLLFEEINYNCDLVSFSPLVLVWEDICLYTLCFNKRNVKAFKPVNCLLEFLITFTCTLKLSIFYC